jgi:hypothetical protein
LAAVSRVDEEPSRVGEARRPAAGRLSYDVFKGPSAKLQPLLAPEANMFFRRLDGVPSVIDHGIQSPYRGLQLLESRQVSVKACETAGGRVLPVLDIAGDGQGQPQFYLLMSIG